MRLINFFKSLFLSLRFFQVVAIAVFLFITSYFIPILLPFVKILAIGFVLAALVELLLLYRANKGLFARRETPEKLSNGDNNILSIYIENFYTFTVHLEIIDEIPHQFQVRDVLFKTSIPAGKTNIIKYQLRPTKRGEYQFGAVNIYATGPMGLIKRRFRFSQNVNVPVYPSYIQMRQYELMAISNRLQDYGIKKIRRLGQSMEFEQIKGYVIGDDYRTINWKATARRNDLMVNQFQEEKSQQIYCIIDKGRVMQMPFNGLSLMDYSINASLVISNIAIKKGDKSGLITFSHQMGNMLKASNTGKQMRSILEMLYKQKTLYLESDFESLYVNIHKRINKRSLLILFTNFESLNALQRQLPYFRRIAKRHLLVIVFFENTELTHFLKKKAANVEEIYEKAIAEKFDMEKRTIVKELQKHGIQSIFTTPEELTVNTINKYLEIKARGLL